MLSHGECDQIRSEISRIKSQIVEIDSQIGQVHSEIDQLRDEIGDENEARRIWGSNRAFDLNTSRDIKRLQWKLDELYGRKDGLLAEKACLYERKKSLYRKLEEC
jgi:uncharacterized coiled-coil DUF342 family protein